MLKTVTKIFFELPDAGIPFGLMPGNADMRTFAIGMKSLQLVKIPRYNYGEMLLFGKG